MMKNLWNYFSLLGVNDKMPLYRQKSIILFNQIIRVIVLMLITLLGVLYFYFHLRVSLYILLSAFPIIALSLILNLKGKLELSLGIISFSLPILILILSVSSKLEINGNNLTLFIAPRIGIIASTLIPVAISGFKNSKTALLSGIFGFIVFFAFDYVHRLFGIVPENIPFNPGNFWVIKYTLAGIMIFSLILILFLQNINFTYEQLVNKQNEEIIAQRDTLFEQNETISKQQNKTISSLNYAKKIQQAILPPSTSLERDLNGYFLIFKPRDIVSGDFYWKRKIDNTLYIAIADCTGHGVPGAFMSMLSLAFLNDIVNQNHSKNIDAGSILNKARDLIKKSLRQEKENTSRDGMDIALCKINVETYELNFSGANSNLIYFSNNQLNEIKGDRQPIGIHRKEVHFSNHYLKNANNYSFYMFSDGFPDQIGGPFIRKYKRNKLKELLQNIQKDSFSKQKEIIENEILDWMQYNNKKIEQVDDITIFGFRP